MQLHSKAFGKSFDFVTFEKEENGEVIKIITHTSLFDVINNEVEGVDYGFQIHAASPAYSAVTCKMSGKMPDGTVREIQAIGESLPETLVNEIARNYPTTMAWNRAFDKAAIRFLNLPDKVFSNLEIPIIEEIPDDCTVVVEEETVPEVKGIVSTVIEEEVGDIIELQDASDIVIPDEIIIDDDENNTIVIDEVEANNNDDLPFSVDEDTDEDLSGYVITMNGQYQNSHLTIAQIYEKNIGYIHWVAGPKFVGRNTVAQNDKEAVQKFVNADATRKAKFEAYLKELDK